MNNFEDLRTTYQYLSDEQWLRFSSLFERMEVPAKTILLREGDTAKKAYWIEKGCIRVWFNNKGKDSTFQFFFEGQGISSIESFRKHKPSFFTIETIEPCVLYRINKTDLDMIINDPDMKAKYNDLLREFLFERQLYYMQELLSFIRDTPEERYRNLAKERPYIIQRVPQHYIASYLGITSVSLSRIRSRLLKK